MMNRLVFLILSLLVLANLCWADNWSPQDGLILQGNIVTMNDSSEVIQDGKIVIVDEKIVSILKEGDDLPDNIDLSNAKVITTLGWIFPGLIDSHNHVSYNFLPIYEVPKKYDNRYQWGNPNSYKQYVNYPKTLLTEKSYFDLEPEVIKYAEVKAIVGGVTSIQGSPNLTATRLLVRNIEHLNFDQDRIYQHGLSIDDSRFLSTLENGLLRLMDEGNVDAWLVHLAEGTDDKSRKEFETLKSRKLLKDVTVVIHGTALTKDNFREMATYGTKLIWSPLSNLLLYGQTTDIPSALKENVLVSLGTDWSPSGSKNLLGELKIADGVDTSRFGNVISDELLIRMVTSNPAFALGLDDKIGQLKEGLYADISVFDKIDENPYLSLIKSTERHVQLVLVGGNPLYGDKAILVQLKPDDIEIIFAAGREKAIDTTLPVVPKGEQKLAEIIDILNQALLFDRETMKENFGNTMTDEEFDVFLEKKFPAGIIPVKLDPIFAYQDDYFFHTIDNSDIAKLNFDYSQFWKGESVPDQDVAVLTFLNRQETTTDILDFNVGLDQRAAINIIKHRSGQDGVFGTSDDNLFDSLEELDQVTYVGRSAIEKIKANTASCNTNSKIIIFLNSSSTTLELLDNGVGLDRRAAENIISHRDGEDMIHGTADDNLFDNFKELDLIPFVGETAIGKISDFLTKNTN
ncbi:MAG: amidohydrolase family protein [Pseudomonadota bacterium]